MGTVVISLDAELGWGFHHLDELPGDRIRNARENWRWLLDLFDEYEVPATWAVVGRLLGDEPGLDRPEHPEDESMFEAGAPGLSAEETWLAGGLVEDVRGRRVGHEVASHGHSHVHFNHDAMSWPFAKQEVEECVSAAETRDIDLRSFVFPVNEVNYRRLLVDGEFDCYRGRNPLLADPTYERTTRKYLRAILNRGTPPVVRPTVDEFGLVNVPASLYLFSMDGPAGNAIGAVHGDPVTELAKRGIDEVGGRDGVLHLWLHPHNLTDDRHYERLRDVMDYVDWRREAGDLDVATMAEVADRTRGERESPPDAERASAVRSEP